MRTSVLKRGTQHSERDDRERRNYPPAALRRINAAIQTPAESNLPPQLRQFARFSMCETVTRRRCGGQLADLLRCRQSRDPLLSISCEPRQLELAETRSESPIASTNLQRGQAHNFPESRYQRAATRVRTSAPFRFPLSFWSKPGRTWRQIRSRPTRLSTRQDHCPRASLPTGSDWRSRF